MTWFTNRTSLRVDAAVFSRHHPSLSDKGTECKRATVVVRRRTFIYSLASRTSVIFPAGVFILGKAFPTGYINAGAIRAVAELLRHVNRFPYDRAVRCDPKTAATIYTFALGVRLNVTYITIRIRRVPNARQRVWVWRTPGVRRTC